MLPLGKDKEAAINSLPKSSSKVLKNLFVMKDTLKHGAGQVAVSEHLRLPLLKWHHDSPLAGHRAYETTVYAMSARYFWPGMKSYILEYCKTCSGCQTFNFKNSTARHPLMPIVASRPGEIVSLDFAGPFRRTKRGNQYAIVAIDKFTKWLEGAPTKNFDAVTSSVFLVNEWICRHGMVERILTDR